MKKLVAILLCLLLVCCLAVPAFAAGASISLSASGTTLQRGDTVTITVNFSSSENIKTASLSSLNFNSSVFEAVSGTCNKSICDFGNYNKDRVGIAMVWDEEGKYSGQMGTITLKVKDNAPLGTYTISGNPVFKNGNNVISASSNSVTITVSCNHSWGAWSNAGNDGHARTCPKCTTTETVAHDWDNGKVTKAATCKEDGVKTYTCNTTGCGATKTDPISKDTVAHTWGKWEKVSDTQHKRTCTVCTTASETAGHTWDNGKETKPATCKDEGEKTFTCADCGATKIEKTPVTNKHSFGNLSPVEGTNKHKDTCSVCKKEIEEDHTWSAGTVTKAATCKEDGVKTFTCTAGCGATKTETISKDTVAHTWGKWQNLDADNHKHICTVCGDSVFETAKHTFNAGTVTKTPTCKEDGVRTFTCTGCGAEKTEKIEKKTEHAWGKWTEVDATNHKRTCTVCGDGVSETKQHGFGTKWTTDKNQHWHACADCGAKKDAAAHTPGAAATETTAQRCTTCNYIIKAALGHTHKWDTKYTTDGESHWYACSGCNEKKDAKAHDFANDCDALCETCQYTRETTHKFGTEWTSDETGHFHACTVCGEKADVAEHAPGVEATETTAQTCTACGFELAPALGHTHVFGEVWEKDDVNHWHVCACGEKADEAAHEWNDQGACPTCLAQKPAEEKAGFPWWIILVAVLGIGVVVAIVVVAKKKKK